ncbi:MAG: chemotaxis protein CheW [Brevundimonas sp.]|uniref:chemotaxis protein CheW n=1 Tax=Brevundimonas sp. TaxID=1871086 RepID=UPI002734AA20|nr:chemotaxis protein CheW [Brevundimonas sp.]MBX9615135.1 chemotaxis protein CheW [Caulobacteraceae bacterium]MDP3406373.1 chemotaxis protein CheW [Brevundimonas sp.]
MPSATTSAEQRELVAFRMGAQQYCVDIHSVLEIRGWAHATQLPLSPSYVRGVMNLRGTVLPVIDLGTRLGIPVSPPSARHVIIVAKIERKTVGLLVEAVSDILTVGEELIQPTPDIACETVRAFVRGIIPVNGAMISLLSLDGLLPDEIMQEAA